LYELDFASRVRFAPRGIQLIGEIVATRAEQADYSFDGAEPARPAVRTSDSFTARKSGFANSKERLRVQVYAVLLALDLSSILLGFAMASAIRFRDPFAGPGISLAFALAPVFTVLAFSRKAYSIEALSTPRQGVIRALTALGTAAVALLMMLFYTKTAGVVSRLVFGIGVVGAGAWLTLSRQLFGQVIGRRHNWSFVNEVLLVDGATVHPDHGQIVVFASTHGLSPEANDPVAFDRLGRLLANCDRVILAAAPDRRGAWTAMLKCAGISVELLTPELDALRPLQLRSVGGSSAVLVAVGPLGLRDRLIKRLFDLSIAVPALVVLAPVVVAAAIAIKLTSPGPILFRQERVGESNRIFSVLKFRTMRTDDCDEAGGRSTAREDERVTPVGRLLRRTSIDELPQLINVVLGSMSLVGPRPHALASTAEEELFWHVDDRYWERGKVKPGITGLAQVRGLRGPTMTRSDITSRVQADLEYLSEWTIWRDIGIVIRTLTVLVHQNAF
jgi:polysaccharide biosynthesis protein PslA